MTTNTDHFKEALLKEKKLIEGELLTVGRKNPENPEDWEAEEKNVESDSAEEGDVAEGIEQFENNSAILEQLESRLAEVKKALDKIESGNFGKCEICGEKIEEDRLEANPSAATCKTHMNQ